MEVHLKIAPEDIAAIEVETFWTVVASYNQLPATGFDVVFSTQLCIALLLHGVPVGPAWHDDANCENPALLATARKVTLREWDEATEYFSRVEREFLARVRLRTRTGEEIEARVDIPEGDPRNPLSEETLCRKFEAAFRPLGPERAAAAATMILKDLPGLDRLDKLTALLRPGG